MHKVNCLRFFKSRSLPQTCKFTWEAFLDLKENRGHCRSRSRITVREPSTGLQREYTSSNRVAQKVADIIQKRWKPDLTMSEEWNKVLGKIYSLEQKIQALTTTNYQSSPGTDCKLST
ncbi:uncharacterized protein LOC111718397 [Eurytemora carolleeae]|uniref:uncharacterized protein LOC111718397 n=1 Tax=Eurytemora carolleeae TaxID=1294199 RepID=UPI000C78CA76|nr:uncharacterized protein LOC111718397 [Eurytemora carolleeae]|eukprot:XP_023349743.1 uncharacterized protein LOC111718397 [Eurytemora affinis]